MKKTRFHTPYASTRSRSNGQFACINGKFVSIARASISIFDRGFLYGDGVFETLRVYRGKIFRLKDHLARLESGCNALKIRGVSPPRRIASAAAQLVVHNQIREGFVRILITRGPGDVGLGTANAQKPVLIIYAQSKPPRPESEYRHGWRVIISTIPANAKSWVECTKTISRVHHIMAKVEAEEAGVNDAILLNTNGHITEGTTSSIFIVRNRRLITPPIQDGLLAGITRAAILEVARRTHIPTTEKHLLPNDILGADEVFLTSTLLEIMPIVEVDGRKIGLGRPGLVTQRLHVKYCELVRRELGISSVAPISQITPRW